MRTALLLFLTSALSAQDYPQDMPLSRVLIDGEGWELLGEGYGFTEGPAVDRDGNVYFTDIPKSRIHRIDRDGKITLFAEDTARTNGLMFGPDGRLYGCRNGEKKIVAYDMKGGVHTIAEGVASNDIVVDSRGHIYFTDLQKNQVWHIPPGGKPSVAAKGWKPNGLILWPGEGTLVVTDWNDPQLWTFRVEADGRLTHRERYYLPVRTVEGKKEVGADGMTFDKVGRIYVATHAGLQMFDPTGRMGGVIAKPQGKFLSNAVFGGPDFSWLYVTCSDKVYRRKTKSPGAPYILRAKGR